MQSAQVRDHAGSDHDAYPPSHTPQQDGEHSTNRMIKKQLVHAGTCAVCTYIRLTHTLAMAYACR